MSAAPPVDELQFCTTASYSDFFFVFSRCCFLFSTEKYLRFFYMLLLVFCDCVNMVLNVNVVSVGFSTIYKILLSRRVTRLCQHSTVFFIVMFLLRNFQLYYFKSFETNSEALAATKFLSFLKSQQLV